MQFHMNPTLANEHYINTTQHIIHHHDVFLDNSIQEPEYYRDFLTLLFNANPGDKINLFINSEGGDLDAALAIVEGLKTTEAEVTGILIGACLSAASIIAMYCHQVVVLDNAYMMVHTATFGSHGNTGNVKSHTEFTIQMVERLLQETYKGFLDFAEIEKILSGVELWFKSNDIKERFIKRVRQESESPEKTTTEETVVVQKVPTKPRSTSKIKR